MAKGGMTVILSPENRDFLVTHAKENFTYPATLAAGLLNKLLDGMRADKERVQNGDVGE